MLVQHVVYVVPYHVRHIEHHVVLVVPLGPSFQKREGGGGEAVYLRSTRGIP